MNPFARNFLRITSFVAFLIATTGATAHGFNANYVQLVRIPNGLFRVIIKYTHVEIGEYREAHADFARRDEALKLYWDLAKGADFFLGKDLKSTVHFHTEAQKNNPY